MSQFLTAGEDIISFAVGTIGSHFADCVSYIRLDASTESLFVHVQAENLDEIATYITNLYCHYISSMVYTTRRRNMAADQRNNSLNLPSLNFSLNTSSPTALECYNVEIFEMKAG